MDQDGRNGQDQGARIPPDEQMRLARARSGSGFGSDQPGAGTSLIGGPGSGGEAGTPTGEGPDTIDLSPRFRPWSEPAQGSGVPLQCHFLRTVGADGKLTEAQATAVPSHRCAAFGDPLPLSLRQQELVCLQRVHVSCPRYVRGTLLASEAEAEPEGSEGRHRFPIMTIVMIGLVALSILLLIAGGLGLFPGSKPPSNATTPPAIAGGSASPTSAATATAAATPAVTATPAATPTAGVTATPTSAPTATPKATATPTLAPTPTPKATPKPTAAPTASWPPGATASRMNLLTPCTDQPNCYLYTVRSAAQNGSNVNDDLDGIARFFGVSKAAILELNPWASAGISPGQQLKIPPPTR